ncbi:class I SAM-dependent methyltransferase [Streptomyces sp. NPDC018045]|uniref:class I SAM-dependent methyltransferase n=1 Tax=Streptomyces sp. NPDC018045 TaxID=3365037 RepID=UPI0037BC6BC5
MTDRDSPATGSDSRVTEISDQVTEANGQVTEVGDAQVSEVGDPQVTGVNGTAPAGRTTGPGTRMPGAGSPAAGPANRPAAPATGPGSHITTPGAPLADGDSSVTSASRRIDAAVRAYVRRHPCATVVALGEGLGAAFWRLDNGRLRWLAVEPPETAAVRRMLLPDGPRRWTLACPVTDSGWLDAVGAPERGVVVTARGLLMFLRPPEVRALFAACAERFPGGALVFDTVPRWCAGRARPRTGVRTAPGTPPLRWGMNAGDRPGVAGAHPNIVAVREVPPPGRGPLAGRLARWREHVPLLHTPARSVTEIRFGTRGSAPGPGPDARPAGAGPGSGGAPADPERAAGRRSR